MTTGGFSWEILRRQVNPTLPQHLIASDDDSKYDFDHSSDDKDDSADDSDDDGSEDDGETSEFVYAEL